MVDRRGIAAAPLQIQYGDIAVYFLDEASHYPGEIRVTLMRETRVIEYAK